MSHLPLCPPLSMSLRYNRYQLSGLLCTHLCHQVCYLQNVHLRRLLVTLKYSLAVSSLVLFSFCGFSMQSPTLDFEYFSMILLVL